MDRIEKKVVLKASRERVWRAISDASEFGSWFGVSFDQPFAAGAKLTGKIVPTTVDAEVAKSQAPYSGQTFECHVERIEPQRLFSFRWHPFAVEKGVDYSSEPMTLVELHLDDAPQGTLLTITESGFDRIPLARRAKAFEMNDGGWAAQARLLAKYVER